MKIEKTISLYTSIFLLCMSILSYEILLTRVFSIRLFAWYAYLIISIALLGFGASGSILTAYWKKFDKKSIVKSFKVFFVLMILSLLGSFFLTIRIPISILYLVSDLKNSLAFVAICVATFIPFLMGGFIIGMLFTVFSDRINTIYAVDLLGAGFGGLASIGMIRLLGVPTSFFLLAFFISVSLVLLERGLIGKASISSKLDLI